MRIRVPRYRDGPRRSLLLAASLWSGEKEYACAILNLSLGGAKVQLDAPLEVGIEVRLEIPDLCILDGRLAWNRLGCIGIQFTTKPDEARLLLGDKARDLDLDGKTGRGGGR